MRIKGFKHIISLISFLVIAFFSGNRLEAGTIVSASSKIVRSKASSQLPHAAMELVKQEVTTGCHCTIQKKLFVVVAWQPGTGDPDQISSANFFIKRSFQLTRNYLLHIYPFHYFW